MVHVGSGREEHCFVQTSGFTLLLTGLRKKKLYFGIDGWVLKQLLLGVEVPGLGTLWRSEHPWA